MKKPLLCALAMLMFAVGCGVANPEPTATPSATPTVAPTSTPTATQAPTVAPTPTNVPTATPTATAIPVTSPVPPSGVDVPILMYHRVGGDGCIGWCVSHDLFARQMDALRAYGYDTVSLDDFVRYRNGLAIPPDRPVIITFDDGYQSFYTQAVPILQARGMVATVFAITGLLWETNQDRQLGSSETSEQLRHLTWEEVKTLYAQGFGIGSHTATHANLKQVSDDQARREVTDSCAAIRAHLGDVACFLAYPYGVGADNPNLRVYLEQAGYEAALTAYTYENANTATSDIWALPRITITESNTVDLDPAHPFFFFMRRLDRDFPIPVITIDGLAYYRQDGSPGNAFHPGETITVGVTITNKGDPVKVQVTLKLDDGSDHDGLLYYDQALAGNLDRDETETFEFALTLPRNVASGQHYYQIVVRDEYSVLRFGYSDWREAFTVLSP